MARTHAPSILHCTGKYCGTDILGRMLLSHSLRSLRGSPYTPSKFKKQTTKQRKGSGEEVYRWWMDRVHSPACLPHRALWMSKCNNACEPTRGTAGGRVTELQRVLSMPSTGSSLHVLFTRLCSLFKMSSKQLIEWPPAHVHFPPYQLSPAFVEGAH